MFSLLRIIGSPVAMQPTQIDVIGRFSHPSGIGGMQVELVITPIPGGPATTLIELTSTGATGMPPIDTVTFKIPAWASALCGEQISFDVRGDIGSPGQPQWTAWQTFSGNIVECFCPRVSLQAIYGLCQGNPLKQSITLTASIMMAPHTPTQFSWDFGDGTGASGGTQNNLTSDWNSPVVISIIHDFDPSGGSYIVTLNSGECPNAKIKVSPNCTSVICCDEVTIAIDTQPLPCFPVGVSNVLVQFSASLLPNGCTGPFEWKVTKDPTGSNPVVTQQYTPGGTTFPYSFPNAGEYKVTVRVKQAATCEDPILTDSIIFTILPCVTNCPVLLVTENVNGCAPIDAWASFNASWAIGTINPPTPTAYFWTINFPGNPNIAQRNGTAASVDTKSGWSGSLATASGAVDLSVTGTYTISVRAVVPGLGNCDPTCSTALIIPPCKCPVSAINPNQEWTVTNITAPLGPNSFQTLDCNTATINMALSVDPGSYQPGDIRYSWDFGDGSPIFTAQGAAGASPPMHTFNNPTPGQSRTYTVTVTVSVPGSTCNPFSRTALITVPGCTTSVCPSLNQLTPDRATACINSGGQATFNFTAAITNPGSVTNGFLWDFDDGGTPQTTPGPIASHSYQTTGTFTIRVTVNGPAGSNCPSSSQSTTISLTKCSPTTGNMAIGCWVLLVAALVLGIIACILGIVGACTANVYIGIAAGIVGILALALLILWLIFCARGNCGIFNWARWIVMWILMIAPIVGIIVGIVGTPICGLIATGILWGYWGVVLAILDIAGPKIGCPLNPPPFP